jgi:hypothetical protein
MSVAVLDEIAAATGGRVAPVREGIGEDWVDIWEPVLDQVVEEEIALPEDLRVRLAAEIAEYLDTWADYDDDELMLWRARENFPKFLAMEPKIPDPRQKIPESA